MNMKIKVKDLLNLNRKDLKVFSVEEYHRVMQFEPHDTKQVLPLLNDELEERDLINRGKRIPFTCTRVNVSESVNNGETKIMIRLDDIVENYVERDFRNMGGIDSGIFIVNIYYYDGKPIIISKENMAWNVTEMYFMNREYLNKFRNDVLFVVHNTFGPKHIGTRQFHIEGCGNDRIDVDLDNMEKLFMTFDSKTDTDQELIKKIFCDSDFKGEPCVPSVVLQSIAGYPIDDSNVNTADDFAPLPIKNHPRLSLSLHLNSDELPEDYFEGDWDWQSSSIWTLNIDGIPTLLYMLEDAYYVQSDWVYILNEEKYPELTKIIRDLYVPEFKEIPDSEFVTEEDEIEIDDSELITHEIRDNTLYSIVHLDKYDPENSIIKK